MKTKKILLYALIFSATFGILKFTAKSLADIYSQKNPYGTFGTSTGTTATGGTIGASATTATGVGVGSTEMTATGVTMGVTSVPNPNEARPLTCLEVGGKKLCGSEAMGWCRDYPLDSTCQKIMSEIEYENSIRR